MTTEGTAAMIFDDRLDQAAHARDMNWEV